MVIWPFLFIAIVLICCVQHCFWVRAVWRAYRKQVSMNTSWMDTLTGIAARGAGSAKQVCQYDESSWRETGWGPHPGLKPGTPLPAPGCTAPSPSRRSACSSWAEDSVPVLPLRESCCGTTQLPDSAPLLGFSWNLSGAWLSPTPCFHHPLHSVITIACVCGNYLHFVHYQETHLRTRSLVLFTLISRVLCIMPGKRQMPNSLT